MLKLFGEKKNRIENMLNVFYSVGVLPVLKFSKTKQKVEYYFFLFLTISAGNGSYRKFPDSECKVIWNSYQE